jgi:hypothetical protein
MTLWRWLTTPSGKPVLASTLAGALLRWLWDAPIAAHSLGAIAAALLGHHVYGLGGWWLVGFVLLLGAVWQAAKADDGVYGADWPAEVSLRLAIAVPWAALFGLWWP